MTDLCAEFMHAQLEMEGRGFEGVMASRSDRVALIRAHRPSVTGSLSDLVTSNPLAAASGPVADPKKVPEPGDDRAESGSSTTAPLTLLELGLWMLTAAGQMSPWTGMGAFSSVFKAAHGSSILLELNTAYFAPALPSLMLAMFLIPRLDRWLGHRLGYTLRVVVCQSVISVMVMLFPAMSKAGGKPFVVAASVVIGVFGGLGYGSIFAFNSLWPSKASSVFSMGLFLPGFLFMALHAAIGFTETFPPSADKKAAHWYFAGSMGLVGIVAFLALLYGPRGAQLCDEMDARARATAAAATLVGGTQEGKDCTPGATTALTISKAAPSGSSSASPGGEGSARRSSSSSLDSGAGPCAQDGDVEMSAVAAAGSQRRADATAGSDAPLAGKAGAAAAPPGCLPGSGAAAAAAAPGAGPVSVPVYILLLPSLGSVFVSIIAIVSITSFFTAAPSADPSLPATLFYVKNGCDFLGRAFTLAPPVIRSQWQLVASTAVRFTAMPLFFVYVFTEALGRSDGFLVALVAVSAVISGYLNTMCYQLAAKSVSPAQKPAASTLMNMSFQASLLASIGLSFAILAVA